MPPGNVSFFDVAATLIPLLLLGGAITERLRRERPPSRRGRWTDVLVVFAFGAFPAYAEIVAINAALGDVATASETWTVAVAVGFGTFALGVALVWPWIQPTWSGSAAARVGLSAGALVLVAAGVSVLRSGVEYEVTLNRLEQSVEAPYLSDFYDELEAFVRAQDASGELRKETERQLYRTIAEGRLRGLLEAQEIKPGLARRVAEAVTE